MQARDLVQLKPMASKKLSENSLAFLVPPDPDGFKLRLGTDVEGLQGNLPSGDPGLIFFIEGTAIGLALYGLGRVPLNLGIVFFRLARRDVDPKPADQISHRQGSVQRAGFGGMFAVAVLDDQAIAVRPDLQAVPSKDSMDLLPSCDLPQGLKNCTLPLRDVAVKGLLPCLCLNRSRDRCQPRLRDLH